MTYIELLQKELAEANEKLLLTQQKLEETETDLKAILNQFSLFFTVFSGKAGNALAQASKMLMWEPEKFAEMGQTMAEMLFKYNITNNQTNNDNGNQPTARKGFFRKLFS